MVPIDSKTARVLGAFPQRLTVTLNLALTNYSHVKHLIIRGDPGLRAGDELEYDGDRLVCFQVSRNGEWHGPKHMQLWALVGEESERDQYERREFTPHALEVERVDAAAVTVYKTA